MRSASLLSRRGDTMVQVKFSVVQDAHDNWPRPFVMPWDELAVRCADHREGEKDGTALICATFTGLRRKETLAERQLVAIDVELDKTTGQVPPPPQTTANIIASRGLAACVWTTFSHRADEPRFRVLMPLSEPIWLPSVGPAIDRMISATPAYPLRLGGVQDTRQHAATRRFCPPRPRP